MKVFISTLGIFDVKLEDKYALVEMEDMVKDEEIKAVVEEVGYEVVGIETQ